MNRALLAGAAVLSLAIATPAEAVIFNLTEADPAANLGPGPYGTVAVTENSGSLDFLMTLNSNYRIHQTTADNHLAFAFSILGNPNVSVTGLASGFTAVSPDSATNVSSPPFGIYFTGLDCGDPACGPGWGGGYAGPLSFTVTSLAGAINLSNLGFNLVDGKNIYFTTDLVRNPDTFTGSGGTGNVGATLGGGGGLPPPVPEPATWAMMLVGFGAIGAAMRRKHQPSLRFNFA